MADDPAYIRALKAFTRAPLAAADLEKLEDELYGTNDRASAVILGSILESALRDFLRTRLRPELNSDDRKFLFNFEGPLGTFSAKIAMAYAIGAIGPLTRGDLDLIRLLRNEFAHSSKHFSFDTPEVADVCARLRTPSTPGAFIPHGSLVRTYEMDDLAAASDKRVPRTRFRTACYTISYRMITEGAKFSMATLLAAMPQSLLV